MNMCPGCLSQQVTKATAIVRSGTATGTTQGVGVGAAGRGLAVMSYGGTSSMQSNLARHLAPPPYPKKPTPLSVNWAIVCICLMLLFSFPLVCLAANAYSYSAYSINSPGFLYNFAPLGLILAACVLGLVLSIIQTARTAPRRAAEHQTRIARWHQAMGNWQQLYYCHTCDSVYLPHTGQVAPIDQMYRLL